MEVQRHTPHIWCHIKASKVPIYLLSTLSGHKITRGDSKPMDHHRPLKKQPTVFTVTRQWREPWFRIITKTARRAPVLLHLPDLKNAAMSAASLDVSSPSPELILGSILPTKNSPNERNGVGFPRRRHWSRINSLHWRAESGVRGFVPVLAKRGPSILALEERCRYRSAALLSFSGEREEEEDEGGRWEVFFKKGVSRNPLPHTPHYEQ